MVREEQCDVLVVGGGAAGLAAGVAAARTGGRVVLLERYGFLGGTAVAGMVGTVCGLYLRGAGETPEFVSGGFVREFGERLAEASGSRPIEMAEGLHALPYEPWAFQRLADEIARQTRGLELVLHGTLIGLQCDDDRVKRVHALAWNERMFFRTSALVDCTGEALAVQIARGQVEDCELGQAPAVVFAMEGVGLSLNTIGERVAVLKRIARACNDGELSGPCANASFVPAAPGQGAVCLKVGLASPDVGRWNWITRLEMKGRELVDEVSRFLVEEVPAFSQARLSRVSTQIGIRTGRRARGKAVLTEQDVLECRRFRNGVARGAWPIEEWGFSPRPTITCLPKGGYYEIPAGCLTAEGLGNVFMAGRCLSATERALASARVIGTALSTGWAAGALAAAQAAGRTRTNAIGQLRAGLES